MGLIGKEWYGEFIAHKDGFKEGVEEGFKVGYETAKKELQERKTGKWVKDEYGTDHCSCCDYIPAYDTAIDDIYYSPYCPNCGAKMEVDE